jgi:hypothetical protein
LQTSMSADFRYDRFRTGWSGYRNGSRQLLQGDRQLESAMGAKRRR